MNEEKAILSKDNFIHNSIKDAFLQLLLKKDYMQITITDLCKYAGVSEGHFILILVTLDKLLKKFFQMLYMILKIWLCYLRMDQVQIQLSGRGFVGFYGKIRNISPSFFQKHCSCRQ